MKKTALIFIVLLFSFVCASSLAAGMYKAGDTIEDFTVTTPEGEMVTLYGLLEEHKAVLLNFWYVDCPWCVYEFPFLQSAYDAMGGDIAVLALSPYDSTARITQFQQANGLTFLMARDDMGLAQRFGCSGYPTSVMIDRNGVYCFSQSGAFTDPGAVQRLFEAFAADDYSKSLVNFKIPAAKAPAAFPSAKELSAALNIDAGKLSFSTASDNAFWPWLIKEENGRTYAYSSNSFADATAAVMTASVSVKAGDVLAFDYKTSTAAGDDSLVLYIDDVPAKVFTGENDWNSYAYAFAEDGKHFISFYYLKSNAASSGLDLAAVDNVCLLSGETAQAALARNPVYPKTLAGTDVEIELLKDDKQKVLVDDPSGTLSSYYPGAQYFIAPATHMTLRISIGKDIDPDAALLGSMYDNSIVPLSSLPHDQQGYLYSTPMDSLDTTGYAWNLQVVYPLFNDYSTMTPVFYFASEENLDHFCRYNVTEQGNVSWVYADENIAYTLRFVDENGQGVAGVMANICSDELCMPMISDENGVVTFENLPYAYDVHILMAPEGYTYSQEGVILPLTGGEMVFTLQKQ